MKFISRKDQDTPAALHIFVARQPPRWSDSILDGINLPKFTGQINWVPENSIHAARIISSSLASTRFFTGPQIIAVRDEQRYRTHVIMPDRGQLILSTIENGEVTTRWPVFPHESYRAHLSLKKYNGTLDTLHCCRTNNASGLFLNDTPIVTSCGEPDFPFMVACQPPIGHIPEGPPTFSLMTYKCRSSGQVFLRRIDDSGISQEQEIFSDPCVGGIDFAIADDNVLFRVVRIIGDTLIHSIATSHDKGATITPFTPLDLTASGFSDFLPALACVTVDFANRFHIPVAALSDGQLHILDVQPDLAAVEAIETKAETGGYHSLAAFPKKPGLAADMSILATGNGRTDGAGMIASVTASGRLIASNSQAGGSFYPENALLNDDMQNVLCFKATQCYTRGIVANTVSMDYFFAEANSRGDPISQHVFFETWDMPLPLPSWQAVANQNAVELTIFADANFEVGATTIHFDDPSISVMKLEILSDRSARIECNTDQLKGQTLSFEVKTPFYFHLGRTKVQ